MDPRVFFTLGLFTKVKNTPGPPRRRGRRRRLLRRSRVPWLESWCVRKPAARPTRSCATRWGERVINAASPNKPCFTTAARTKISEIGRPIPNWSGILPADQNPLRGWNPYSSTQSETPESALQSERGLSVLLGLLAWRRSIASRASCLHR